jgi:hypothetical protein
MYPKYLLAIVSQLALDIEHTTWQPFSVPSQTATEKRDLQWNGHFI